MVKGPVWPDRFNTKGGVYFVNGFGLRLTSGAMGWILKTNGPGLCKLQDSLTWSMNTSRYNVMHKFILGSDLETQSPKLNSIEVPYMLQNQAQARPKSRQALPLGVFNGLLLGLRCFNSLFRIKEEHPNLESKIVHCSPVYKSHKISIHFGPKKT